MLNELFWKPGNITAVRDLTSRRVQMKLKREQSAIKLAWCWCFVFRFQNDMAGWKFTWLKFRSCWARFDDCAFLTRANVNVKNIDLFGLNCYVLCTVQHSCDLKSTNWLNVSWFQGFTNKILLLNQMFIMVLTFACPRSIFKDFQIFNQLLKFNQFIKMYGFLLRYVVIFKGLIV